MLGKTTKTRTFTAILTTLLILSCLPEQVLAQKASREGLPGRRVGGGTRGECPIQAKRLTALVPENNLGLTVADYPTFFFYVPESPIPTTVEFVLLDDSDRQVYETSFMTAGTGGVINLSLPANAGLPPLTIGKNYHWYFSIVCNPVNRAEDIFVEGWVQRVELDPILAIKLDKASMQEQVNLYAAAGLWHEAITTLNHLRRDRPNDPTLIANWIQLLQSVELDTIAQEPLFNYQTAKQPLVKPLSIYRSSLKQQ